MNYYEHHIGDYDKNTSHLTACEDGIYSRLLRRYYDKEKPLPADVDDVKRLARARSRDERAAVDAVLREFFHLEADGWHHGKCDEVICAYQAGEPEREAKKKNEDARLANHRAQRAELFAVINGAGQHMAWNTPMAELRTAAERIRNAKPSTPATPSGPRPATQPATAPATPATATHSPLPTSHSPELRSSAGGAAPPPAPASAPASPPTLELTAAPARAARKPRTADEPAPTAATWDAYRQAYLQRHGVEPTRNAKVNGQLTNFVARLPAAEAPLVAAFYVRLAGYAGKLHPIDLLLRDCEGIRTQWLQAGAGILPASQPQASSARAARAAEAVPGLAARGRSPLTLDVEACDVTPRSVALQDR